MTKANAMPNSRMGNAIIAGAKQVSFLVLHTSPTRPRASPSLPASLSVLVNFYRSEVLDRRAEERVCSSRLDWVWRRFSMIGNEEKERAGGRSKWNGAETATATGE